MTGGAYADLVAAYVARRLESRGMRVYREVSVGKTIIGKNRRIDIFCVSEASNEAFAIECKYQDSAGTVDLPAPGQVDSTPQTRELDHLLAIHFKLWDVLLGAKRPV